MAERLPVLFVAHAYPRYAGDPVGSFAHNLAVALREEGVDVTVVAPSAPGLATYETIDGITVYRFRYAPRSRETLAYTGTMSAQVSAGLGGKLALLAFVVANVGAALRMRRLSGARLVHAHWWFPAGTVARAVRTVTVTPYVVTLHGSDIRLAMGSGLARRLFASVARHAAAMTAVSSWLADGARELSPRTSVDVSPMPVRTELFEPGGMRDPERLLFIGKLTEQKGLARLLRAMSQMRHPATLTVVGAGRVDDAHLRELAHSLNLSNRIEWLPLLGQAELAGQYRRAAIHVIPALDEGLGLTAVEAQLCETPVVAFRSGGIPDVVMHEQSGLLVPAGDESAMAAALDKLLADSPRRERMGRDGRVHALATFGARAVAQRYAALYRAAIRDRASLA